MSRWSFLALATVPLLLSFLRPAPQPALTWWTTGDLEKIRPSASEPPNATHGAKIHAARNEFEPFQLVLRAQGQDVDGIDVQVSDLRGPRETISSEKYITVYFEGYLDLARPSSLDGGTGEWPDPLIPRIDRFANEKRNAFPFKLTSGRTQPIWIDVFVPPATPAGTYRGEVQVTAAGKTPITVPVELEVWNFQLPSTSSLPTAFGFSGNAAERIHYGRYKEDKDVDDITYLYAKSALWNRITLDGSASILPIIKIVNGNVQLYWDEYDGVMAPFMNGMVFSSNEPLSGAKATSVAIHTPPLVKTPEQQVQFWRQIAQHFREKGWFDRLIDYLWDEPKANSYPAMAELGRLVHKADPALQNLVTAPFHSDWSDFIDIWTPPINCFERKPHQYDFCNPMVERAAYQPELTKGKRLWWYQACGSHGCDVIGGEYFRGWPSYMIDDAPVRNRIMEWLTWKYGMQGELYYSMDEAFARKPDPWKDVNVYAGNGDGTLFYPGRPQVIGGTKQIPIESIRLKLIREGLEDYEYLVLLTKLAGNQEVSDGITGLLHNTYDYDQDPAKLMAARDWLGREINRRVSR
ncbi:MAG TPA: glycoside hydrolase domain-containing protein [Terriglobia bacterium]